MASQMESRDSSSDSDISEWTLVDENSSLEWNDDAKYHFRRSKIDAVLQSHDGSDDDSIEVVSDVDITEEGEEANPEDKNKNFPAFAGDDHASEDLGSSSNIVRYCLQDTKTCHTDCKSLQDAASTQNLTAVNPRDNWDLIVILVVALIGGIALGYFWGLRHEHAVTSKTLTAKLQFENNLLRHKLRCMYLTLKYRTANPENQVPVVISDSEVISLNQHPPSESQYAERLETNILPLEQLINESFAQVLKDENATKQFDWDVTAVKDPNSCKPNSGDADVSIITDQDDEVFVSVEEEKYFELEDLNVNAPNDEIQSPGPNPPLQQTVTKAFSFLSTGGRFWIDKNKSLSLSLDLMENIGRNLQAIDSIQVEQIPPKLYPKFSSVKLKTHKSSNKLVDKVDKYVHKLSKKIFLKLQKFKSNTMKNFCNLKQMVTAENGIGFDWPEEMIQECDAVLRDKNHKQMKDSSKQGHGKPSRKQEVHPDSQKGTKNQAKKLIVKIERDKKYTQLKPNSKPATLDSEGNSDRFAEKITGTKADDQAESKSDDLFLVDYKMSNMSGDWVIEMAKGRAEKRDNDHQSDWLFERAQARKCHRDDENKEKRRSAGQAADGNIYTGKRSEKKFKKIKEMLNNALPSTTTFTDAIKSVKEAYKALRNKVRNPSRR